MTHSFIQFLEENYVPQPAYDIPQEVKDKLLQAYRDSGYDSDKFKKAAAAAGINIASAQYMRDNPGVARYVKSLRFKPNSATYLDKK